MQKLRESRFELARWVTGEGYAAKYNLASTETQGRVANGYYPDKDLEINGGTWEGDDELKKILAARYGTGVDNIGITAGASEANFIIGFAAMRLGDKRKRRGTALVESPIYSPLWGISDILGAKIKFWKRKFKDGFRIDLEALKRQVKGVDIIVMTNLHNPSGVATTHADMKAAAEIAADAGAIIHCDEVFRGFAEDITEPTFKAGDNCITTCSASKFQGMGGVKVGWTVASEEWTQRIWTVREMMSCTCSRIDEEMMKKILADKSIAESSMAIARRNVAIVKNWVESSKGVSWVPSNGGMCFPKLRGVKDSMEFARFLFKECSVVVSPGKYFGLDGHVRIGLGGPGEVLEQGLPLVSEALKKYKE